jgi:multiple sugar transport system permease protein
MVGPYLTILIVFFVAPLLSVIPLSFTRWSILGNPKWIGLQNYRDMLADPSVRQAFFNTLYYVIAQVPVLIVLGFALALLLNSKIPGRILGRTVVIMPYVINVTVMGILWRWMFDPNFGLINHYLAKLGLPRLWWLTDTRTAMLSIVLANCWWSVGFNTVVYLAGLQGIPPELIEAARVDGAGRWKIIKHVILPCLRPVTFYVIIMDTITSFQMFGETFVMTQGGPLGSTTTLTFKIYKVAFQNLQLGYASAISVLLMASIAILVILQFRVIRDEI